MKTKTLALLTFGAYLALSHNLKAEDNQLLPAQLITKATSIPDLNPFAPVVFSGNGVQNFLQNIYNRPNYALDILPNNFSQMLQFFDNGKKGGSRSYAKSVIKLFGNKIKGASYVNAYAFSLLLEQLPSSLYPYFKASPLTHYAPLRKNINDILYSSFLSKFDHLKKDPEIFFDGLSQDIVQAMVFAQNADGSVSMEQLHHATHRFIDTCINKLIWSPEDHTEIWSSVNRIAQQLADLMDYNIITDLDALDDLYWSLVHRFAFFLDITASELPLTFYEKIKNELNQQTPIFCEVEEQEESIITKADHLMQVVLCNEAKVRANLMPPTVFAEHTGMQQGKAIV